MKTFSAILVAVIMSITGIQVAVAAPNSCSQIQISTNSCPIDVSGEIDGDGVTVSVNQGGNSGSGSGGGTGNGSNSGGGSGTPGPGCEDLCRDDIFVVATVGIDDVRHFPVRPGQARMQPDGWTLAGLHTNFYAVVGVQSYTGPLGGETAQVRFTPIAYHWAYGDGQRARRTVKGSTWQSQGIPEFAPTPTSHRYRSSGEYRITLSVEFRAEYRWHDSGWYPVRGTLIIPANELRIYVGGATTVLVGQDCLAGPAGPGC